MLTFQEVLQKAVTTHPGLDRERLTRAFSYAEKIHENQYRISGDPYISHVLEVVNILIDLKPDEDTLIACLLHGVPGTKGYNRKELKELFGEKVFFLVNALESLQKVKSRDESSEAENIRKLFVTMAQDVRVILIKMADRLHNMETLSFRPVQKQKQIAKETLDVYVPISARMSIYRLKGELEDWSFKYLHPRTYEHLKAELDEYLAERERTIEDSIRELKQLVRDNGFEAMVDGRVKNLYSIYRKLKVKSGSTLRDLYDVYAIRIVVPDKLNERGQMVTDHLYSLLGLIHARWRPLGHRFKDYVAVPKPNGYQSLHTAVVGLSPNSSYPTEIQIRTKKMHEEAEFGHASHWVYDETKKFSKDQERQEKAFKTNVDWIDALSYLQNDDGEIDIVDRLRLDVFHDRIFVMTPTGEVKDLPKGSTPVDFAYAVHTDVGHRCKLAKVNDAVVPLDYQLKNGEVVEIVLGKKQDPKPLWLSFAKTSGAKTKIRSFFRSQDKESIFRKGKELLNEELAKLGKPLLDESLTLFREYNSRRLSLREREGLIEEVGNRSVDATSLLKKVFGPRLRAQRTQRPLDKKRKNSIPTARSNAQIEGQISIAGETGLPYRLGNCCKPRKGLPIVAYVTRGHSMTIHLQRCKLLRDAREERILEATWGKPKIDQSYSVKIRLRAKDRVGLIRDIADVITSMNVNIRRFSETQREDDEIIFREVVVDVAGDSQLDQMMDRLERIRNVLEVKREEAR